MVDGPKTAGSLWARIGALVVTGATVVGGYAAGADLLHRWFFEKPPAAENKEPGKAASPGTTMAAAPSPAGKSEPDQQTVKVGLAPPVIAPAPPDKVQSGRADAVARPREIIIAESTGFPACGVGQVTVVAWRDGKGQSLPKVTMRYADPASASGRNVELAVSAGDKVPLSSRCSLEFVEVRPDRPPRIVLIEHRS